MKNLFLFLFLVFVISCTKEDIKTSQATTSGDQLIQNREECSCDDVTIIPSSSNFSESCCGVSALINFGSDQCSDYYTVGINGGTPASVQSNPSEIGFRPICDNDFGTVEVYYRGELCKVEKLYCRDNCCKNVKMNVTETETDGCCIVYSVIIDNNSGCTMTILDETGARVFSLRPYTSQSASYTICEGQANKTLYVGDSLRSSCQSTTLNAPDCVIGEGCDPEMNQEDCEANGGIFSNGRCYCK